MAEITKEGKRILERFKEIDPTFSDAAEQKAFAIQKRTFNEKLSSQVNEGAQESDFVAVFTDREGEIKAKMNTRKLNALGEWDADKLLRTYGIDQEQMVNAKTYLTIARASASSAPSPRDP